MIKTEKLEIILDKCHIIKEFAPLPPSVLGHYHYDENYYLILINESIRNNEKLYRTVLAEEIGHYRTTIGDITPRRYMHYTNRIVIDKKELLALRWAVNFLVPTELLLSVIKDRLVSTLEEIADFFVVTEEFIIHKLEFMSKEKLYWEIDETKYLVLSNLPSIHIYNKFE